MIKFIKDIFSNPDGSGSTKRTAGWLLLACSIVIGFSGVFLGNVVNAVYFDAVFFGFLTTATSMFGLSSFDYSSFINKKDNTNGNQQ
jgi:hypothetical protein